jgi:phosphate-selective porin OprO/OprP
MPVDPLPSFATRARPCERILHPCPGASRADVVRALIVRALIVRAVRCSAAITCVLTAAPLHAQRGSGDDERPAGLLLSDARDVRVTVGGYLQADVRAASARGGSDPDGVLLRRARLTLEASGRGGWTVRLQPDFGQGRAQIQDGYVAWARGPAQARAGRFRPPYGVERALPSSALLFPERSLLNAFMPSRLFGAEAQLRRARWGATAGVFQAAGIRDALVDTDGDPVGVAQAGADAVLRAAWRPFRARWRDDAPPPLELQAGGMVGRYRGTDPEFPGVERFLTSALRPALAWREAEEGQDGVPAGGATLADGARRRATVGGQLAVGPVHVIAERAWLAQRVRRDVTGAEDGPVGAVDRARLRHGGWHVRASWLAGGARETDYDVRPTHRLGALEVGVRAAGARFDRASARFADPDASARALDGVGLAAAWVPRSGTRLALSGDLTRLTPAPGGRPRGTERALVARVQQGF